MVKFAVVILSLVTQDVTIGDTGWRVEGISTTSYNCHMNLQRSQH